MSRRLRLTLAAAALGLLALGTFALGTTGASAHGIGLGLHGGGIHIGGFHGGWGWWGPRYGVRRIVLPVYGGCIVQRWITADGYFAARRVCY